MNLEGVELTEGVGKQASLVPPVAEYRLRLFVRQMACVEVDRERARKKKKAGHHLCRSTGGM